MALSGTLAKLINRKHIQIHMSVHVRLCGYVLIHVLMQYACIHIYMHMYICIVM